MQQSVPYHLSLYSVQHAQAAPSPIALETQPSVSRHTGLKNMVRPARDHAATKHTVQANVEIDRTYFIGIYVYCNFRSASDNSTTCEYHDH